MTTLQLRSFKNIDVLEFYNECRTIVEDPFSAKSICLDFTRIGFVEPVGVVTLSNIIRFFRAEGFQVEYICPDDYVERPRFYDKIDFLDDCLFFEKNFGKKLHRGSNLRSTSNGIEFISNLSFNQMYIDNTINWLKTNMSLRDKDFGELYTILSEIFNNIIDHSNSEIGGTAFAQFYPYKEHIKLSISDFGVGIANKIKTTYKVKNDWNAIELSTEAKVSTKSSPKNRGMGLNNLLSIVENNKGQLEIVSNWGKYVYNGTNQVVISRESDEYYQGTLINILFRTDTLSIEEEEGFEWF